MYIKGKITGDWLEKMSWNDFISWIIDGAIQSYNCNLPEGYNEWDRLSFHDQIEQIQWEMLSFFNDRKDEVYMVNDKNINLTEDELQLIYAACMSYGDKLSDIAKQIPNESLLLDGLADKAKKAWNLARKICEID